MHFIIAALFFFPSFYTTTLLTSKTASPLAGFELQCFECLRDQQLSSQYPDKRLGYSAVILERSLWLERGDLTTNLSKQQPNKSTEQTLWSHTNTQCTCTCTHPPLHKPWNVGTGMHMHPGHPRTHKQSESIVTCTCSWSDLHVDTGAHNKRKRVKECKMPTHLIKISGPSYICICKPQKKCALPV